MRMITNSMAAVGIFFASMLASCQTAAISPWNAINAGNQAWIDGVKAGDVKRIAATYAEDAVDCQTTGECIRGRAQIEQQMTTQLASLGRARSAAVKTSGSTEQGSFVYEWGQAEATFEGGNKLVERYLTAWHKEPDGTWKIFRNMVIPAK